MSSYFEYIFEKPQDQNMEMEIDEPITINEGISEEDSRRILAHLVPYLSSKSLLECRNVCKTWCDYLRNEKKIIDRYKYVVKQSEGGDNTMTTREGVNFSLFLHPEIVELKDNAFLQPSSELFSPICCSIGEQVSELKIHKCDLQPDEFRSIFVNFPLLNKLTLEVSKLLGKIVIPEKQDGTGDQMEMQLQVKSPLKSLNLFSIQRIDSSHFAYLAYVIQDLEELKIYNCLNEYKLADTLRTLRLDDSEMLKNPLDSLSSMSEKVLSFIRVNSKRLKKLWLYRNYNQLDWLESLTAGEAKSDSDLKLSEFFITETLPEKKLVSLNPQIYEWEEPTRILTFVDSQPSIDSLYVQTFNLFEPLFYAKLLQPQVTQNLHRFTLTVDVLADTTKPSFNLTPYLTNMTNLEYFCIVDAIRVNNSPPLENRYRGRTVHSATGHMIPTLDPSFLKNFPPRLTQLVVKRYWQDQHWIIRAFTDHLEGLTKVSWLNQTISPNPFPSLTRLEIICSVASNISHIWNWDVGLQILILELPLLESLSLVGSNITDVGVCGLPKRFCSIVQDSELLNLAEYIQENNYEFKYKHFKFLVKANFLSALKNLKELNLENSLLIQSTSLILGFRFGKLEHLNLNNCSKIDNAGISALAKNCGSTLKSLKIIGNSTITQFGYNELVTTCPKIQRIEASNVKPTVILQGRYFKLSENFWDIVVNKPDVPLSLDLRIPQRPRNQFRDMRHMNLREWNRHANRKKRAPIRAEIEFTEIKPFNIKLKS